MYTGMWRQRGYDAAQQAQEQGYNTRNVHAAFDDAWQSNDAEDNEGELKLAQELFKLGWDDYLSAHDMRTVEIDEDRTIPHTPPKRDLMN